MRRMTEPDRKRSSIFTHNGVSLFIILIGIILRIAQYIFNRSLTEGEAALALNIVQRSYAQLLKPLDYVQAAPVGFLLLQKFISSLFGTSEYALRLLPLIASIISVFIFYDIAKKILNKPAVSIALILFSVNNYLIYFASEVKQYSSDVFFALVIIWFAYCAIKHRMRIIPMLIFGLISSIALWFSHPALFICSGAVLTMYLTIVRKKQWPALISVLSITVLIILSFAINYSFLSGILHHNQALVSFWQPSFMPLPPTCLHDIKWFFYVFLRTFKFPGGFSVYELFLAVLCFILGGIVMFKERKTILALLVFPIIVTLTASGLQRYPFEGRLLLFITPLLILIIAYGLYYLFTKMYQGSRILSSALVCILLAQPVFQAGYHLVKPRAPEELRQSLDYIADNFQTGDTIYLYYASINAFEYYKKRYNTFDNYITGIEARQNWTNYYKDLEKLQGNKRVWIVFSHIATTYGVDEEKLFVSYLDIIGKQLQSFHASGSAAYLYDLQVSNTID
jgi:4-amino-4-deoxy-L-arabinose transferase-like glycosyltransferase